MSKLDRNLDRERTVPVAVIGAGQAGLAASYWLAQRGIDHVLFDKAKPGDSWRSRWDSFCLVTPNWTLDLPGFPYDGDDPDGFIPRDEIAAYVERYRAHLDPTVFDSVAVNHLTREDDGWLLNTDDGDWLAGSVVVATGTFPFPSTPPMAAKISGEITQMHSKDYRSPSDLPVGAVLVVGSGQSGAQIVDDLLIDGREVWFSIGRSARGPRRYRGRDITRWFAATGFSNIPIQDRSMLDRPSIQVSGRDGGKSIDMRVFGRDGAHLLGRVLEATGSTLTFSDNVEAILQGADEFSRQMTDGLDRFIAENGIDAPPEHIEAVAWRPGSTPTELNLLAAGIGSVIWATGYRYDFSWIDAAIQGDRGYPRQERGVTEFPGLYFIGLLGMHTAGSGLFSGVGSDAEYIVNHIVEARRVFDYDK